MINPITVVALASSEHYVFRTDPVKTKNPLEYGYNLQAARLTSQNVIKLIISTEISTSRDLCRLYIGRQRGLETRHKQPKPRLVNCLPTGGSNDQRSALYTEHIDIPIVYKALLQSSINLFKVVLLISFITDEDRSFLVETYFN